MSDLLFPNGKYPKYVPCPHGAFTAAYVDGALHIHRHYANGPMDTTVLIASSLAGPLQLEDEPFELHAWPTLTQPLRLLARMKGDPGISEWLSSDGGKTWSPAAAYWENVQRTLYKT